MPVDSESEALPTLPFFVLSARLRWLMTRTSAKLAPHAVAASKAQ
jgi:hypothetical protein